MQNGFAPILLLIVLVVFAAVGGGAYYFVKSHPPKPQIQNNVVVSPTPQISTSPVPNGTGETANWKTYTNNVFHYSFSYPGTYTYNDSCAERTPPDGICGILKSITVSSGTGLLYLYEISDISAKEVTLKTPLAIAEAQARHYCFASGMTEEKICAAAVDEQTIPLSSGGAPTSYRFNLQQDSYAYNLKGDQSIRTKTGSKVIGPFVAYYFPTPITIMHADGTKETFSGILVFSLQGLKNLDTFDQILSTFKFTQ